MNTTTTERLFASFPPATDADWRRVAEESLDGAPFDKKLVTRTPEGIDLQPIYSRTDGAKLALAPEWPGLPPFTRGAEALGSRATGWFICQDIPAASLTGFNAALRDDLNRGQNAINLPLSAGTRLALDPARAPSGERGLPLNTLSEVEAALQNVDLAAVPLFAQAGVAALPFTALLTAWLEKQQQPITNLQGAVLADPLGEWLARGSLPVSLDRAYDDMAVLNLWVRRDGLRLRTVGVDASRWTDAGANAVQELAFALATGVDYLRALHARGVAADAAAPQFLFTYGLGSHFFIEVAKLRAARLLWSRAVQAAGGGPEAQRLTLHGRTTRWNKTVLDPHVNLLRTTAEAFAGVVGGCSGLQVGTYDEFLSQSDDVARRLARNIQIILAEECQLGRVVDPAGGSWYVETVTQQLAAKAWALFQDIEQRGGMAAALRAGYPQSLVEKTAADRIAAVEGRRDGVIGTNLHPNLREKFSLAVPAAVPTPPTSRQNSASSTRSKYAQIASCTREQLPAELRQAFRQGMELDTAAAAIARPGDLPAEIKPLVPRRRAEPFEALRRRAEECLAKTGARPKIFLANLGPRKQHAARADFSTGFFAAGGFEAIAGKNLDTPEAAAQAALASGAPIVVICSTDDTYPTLVPPLAQALKAAPKAPVVILAGLPATPELQAQFKAAGVDDFIHIRANCAKMLAGLQDRLGL